MPKSEIGVLLVILTSLYATFGRYFAKKSYHVDAAFYSPLLTDSIPQQIADLYKKGGPKWTRLFLR